MPRTWHDGVGLLLGMWLAFELLVPYVSQRTPLDAGLPAVSAPAPAPAPALTAARRTATAGGSATPRTRAAR